MQQKRFYIILHCKQDIPLLINGSLSLPEYNSFFWDQIRKDIQQLSNITGHSIDEAAVLVHLVLKQINEKGHRVQLTQTGSSICCYNLFF